MPNVWTNAEDTDEEHELIVAKEEYERDDDGTKTSTEYVWERACLKANRLGNSKKRVKEVSFAKTKDGWKIRYLCEHCPY